MFNPIRYPKISITIYTDVSHEGWGASMGDVSTSGVWLPDEKMMLINVLELKVLLLALKSFVKASYKHIKIMSDNATTIHCINEMEVSHSMQCHHQVLKVGNGQLFTKIIFLYLTFMGNKIQFLKTNLDQIILILYGCSNHNFFKFGIRIFVSNQK